MKPSNKLDKKFIRKHPKGQIPDELSKHTLHLFNIPLRMTVKNLYKAISQQNQVTRVVIHKNSSNQSLNTGIGTLKLFDDKSYNQLKADKCLKFKHKGKIHKIEVSDYYCDIEKKIMATKKSRRTIAVQNLPINISKEDFKPILPEYEF